MITTRNRTRLTALYGTAVALSVALAGCGGDGTSDARRYPLSGIVLDDRSATGQVTIAHDTIDGLMPSMAMPFTVRGAAPALGPDDRITATLVVADDETWIENVVVTVKAGGTATPAEAAMRSSLVGTVVPNFRLVNQDNTSIELEALRGQVVMVTFIYTRCPLPDYCPRMMRHLDAVKRALETEPDTWRRVHLLGVSFDPAYDTPAVLRAYGEKFISEPNRFGRVELATAAPAEVQAMAGFFGVKYREEAGQISHSLATAVIATDGKVAAVFPSNTWAPDDAVHVIRREAARISGN